MRYRSGDEWCGAVCLTGAVVSVAGAIISGIAMVAKFMGE